MPKKNHRPQSDFGEHRLISGDVLARVMRACNRARKTQVISWFGMQFAEIEQCIAPLGQLRLDALISCQLKHPHHDFAGTTRS